MLNYVISDNITHLRERASPVSLYFWFPDAVHKISRKILLQLISPRWGYRFSAYTIYLAAACYIINVGFIQALCRLI